MGFVVATSVDDALAALAAGARVIAGGSDLVVGARHGSLALPQDLVAIDRIVELAQIDQRADGCHIGAVVSHDQLMTDPGIIADYTALADAAALVGSPATRNVGTIGGNIMNGSPAMDTGAPLVVLGATVELRSSTATRRLAVSQLWSGPGSTTARADELCTSIVLPRRKAASGSAYIRLEYRRAMEIAVVGAAASVELADDGTVVDASLALTAVAPMILRVDGVTARLAGRPVDGDALAAVAILAGEQSTPISDLRAGADYRRHMVGVMVSRALDGAARRARGEAIAVPLNRAEGIGASP